ncbi:unnamed protein product [Didymodactylos carnosus]|uniref:Alkaline phosphatase, tissue-nonspecific isozyme n=1 Tax=Didymodactylos carnosus TaxID=1234261 RepID=A0A815EJG0_9BILA|nr:unnamed protein product [Didymodactylos carnosus]CAF1307406.1 unnamed protein product [Didymodactylos carnosus]CAF3870922.1 unnamed protein product [Didymodactylos carnosus]CAF4141804.1 unnamed protein product [Didymodactylos carnosus]
MLKLLVYFQLTLIVFGRKDWSVEKESSFWNENAANAIDKSLQRKINTRQAKNVIMFLGDGMGVSTITAGRIRKGQMLGELGEDFLTEMEQFSHLGLAKTYNIDHQTPDSAATATAYLCGVKAQLGTIGVDGRARRANCPSSIGTQVDSVLEWALKQDKKVGIITTATITHASPAAAYAHTPERNWECYDNKYFNKSHFDAGCVDIAYQLASRSEPIHLLLGGGRKYFFPNDTTDVEYNTSNSRVDGLNLVDMWYNKTLAKGSRRSTFVWNSTELNKIDKKATDYIFGLFEPEHMLYETRRNEMNADKPSLTEMTKFAIEYLHERSQGNGFFLFVEGGRIDHGHHETLPRLALDEYVEFDNAIGQAKKTLTNLNVFDDTLQVITADHSHVFTMGAYSSRGSNILGFGSLENANVSNVDSLPINIIAYGNGPNFNSFRNTSLNSLNTNATSYRAPAALPLRMETHGGEDVAVFAHGPWSHLLIGTIEQNVIPHVMAYSACWGKYANREGCEAAKSISTIHRHINIVYSLVLLLGVHSAVKIIQ